MGETFISVRSETFKDLFKTGNRIGQKFTGDIYDEEFVRELARLDAREAHAAAREEETS